MKKTIVRFLSVVFALALTLTMFAGCADKALTDQPASEVVGEGGDEAGSEAATEIDKSKQLVMYTSAGSNGRDEWLMNYAKEAGYNLTVVQIAGADLGNRIIAEKNNQIADIVYGLNAIGFERLKKEDVLEAYKPVWADEIDPEYIDPSGLHYPITVQPLFMAYNTDVYSGDNVPKDYTDLTDPQYTDKYTITKLGKSTAQSIVASILVRYRDDAGLHGVSEEGWEMMKNFIDNGHYQVEDEDYFANCSDGTYPMTFMYGSGVIERSQAMGIDNVSYIVPEIGVPYVIEQTALFKNSKNAELAKDFLDWFGTAEVQAAWSAEFGTIPVQPSAFEGAAPEVKAMMESVHMQEIDWGFVAENVEQWIEKIELEFVG